MNYGEGGLSASDVALLSGRSNSGDGFGEGSGWWIIVFLIFALGGWGRNGFGGSGFGGGSGVADNYVLATDFATIERKLDSVNSGICDATFALNNTITNGFAGVQQTLCQGFNGVNTAVLQSANNTERGFCNLASQLADCCCKIERGIDSVNYNALLNTNSIQQSLCNSTRDIIDSNNNNTRAILDFLTQDKIATLQSENQALKFQASQTAQNAFISANQEAQTAELIRRLGADCPVPAYIVPNPNCCYNYNVTGVGYSNNGCNCGNY